MWWYKWKCLVDNVYHLHHCHYHPHHLFDITVHWFIRPGTPRSLYSSILLLVQVYTINFLCRHENFYLKKDLQITPIKARTLLPTFRFFSTPRISIFISVCLQYIIDTFVLRKYNVYVAFIHHFDPSMFLLHAPCCWAPSPFPTYLSLFPIISPLFWFYLHVF